jgi:hypothetical protein
MVRSNDEEQLRRGSVVEMGAWPLGEQRGPHSYRMMVASDITSREQAYRLAYQVYRRSGFVADRSDRLVVEPYDGERHTLTLLLVTPDDVPVGTLTVVVDSSAGLPCDELYRAEVAALREQGARLVEFTRLAMVDSVKGRGLPVLHLMNFAQVYARLVCGCTDLVIEINPRHAAYYRRKWLFEEEGPERACPRVGGAPAVLLRLPLSVIDSYAETKNDPLRSGSATLPHFCLYSTGEEQKLAEFLREAQRPMDDSEITYFDVDWTTVLSPAGRALVMAF